MLLFPMNSTFQSVSQILSLEGPLPVFGGHPPARNSSSRSSLYFHALTNCPFCNSFLLTFMHRMGGVGGTFLLALLTSNFQALTSFFSHSSELFCSFLHFFALAQNSTLLFSGDSKLFAKNTRGGVPPPTAKAKSTALLRQEPESFRESAQDPEGRRDMSIDYAAEEQGMAGTGIPVPFVTGRSDGRHSPHSR
jgi:hypothetical protein